MEDFTGLIIYIILAIIGILAGIYRTKNKQRSALPPPAKSSAEEEPGGSYESEYDPFAGIFEEKVEEEYLGTENNIEEEELVTEQNADKEELISEQEVTEKDTYNKEYEEGAAVFDKTREVIISDEVSEIKGSEISDTELTKDIFVTEEEEPITYKYDESSEKKKRFDARKAIIYSEILKRKY
jgi:hypothetical protein